MKPPNLNKNFCFASSVLFRMTNNIAKQELTFTGLSPSYAFLIIEVKRSPGIRMTELSERLFLDGSTITRLIEKLEAKGYVIRDSSPGISQVYLTDFGEKVYNNVVIAMENYQNELKSLLGKKTSKELTKSIFIAIDKMNAVYE